MLQKEIYSLKIKKNCLNITKILMGSTWTISCSTLLMINPGLGIPIASSFSLITIAFLIRKDLIPKLTLR